MAKEYVIPHIYPGEFASETNGFTIGRRYPVIDRVGAEKQVAVVLNDNGHRRVILDRQPSPHIRADWAGPGRDRVVGYFTVHNAGDDPSFKDDIVEVEDVVVRQPKGFLLPDGYLTGPEAFQALAGRKFVTTR